MDFYSSKQFKVGIFVLVGIIFTALTIMFLGEDQMILTGTYPLRIKLHQVTGLNRGSQVLFSGLHVGNVKQIVFDEESQDLVALLKIDRRFQTRLTEGMVASIKTLGALGDKYIFLRPGPKGSPPLLINAFIPTNHEEDFIDLIAKKGNDLSSFFEVVNELNILLKNINREGRSAQLVENLTASSAQFKQLLSQTKDSFDKEKINSVISHLSNIVEKIDRGDGTLGALINDSTLHQSLINLIGESPRKKFLKPLIRETISYQSKSNSEEK
ncbi:MAG: MlaD family protein [Bdellovibrionales bacterium]|nr:MlaD family protein [Bdellovibrionales bacterium]